VLIYLDTMLWNMLLDERADADKLISRLAEKGAQIILSTQGIYELAKTFWASKETAGDRGKSLFNFVHQCVALGVPCSKMNQDILFDEALHSVGGKEYVEIFLTSRDHEKMRLEVAKLRKGIFTSQVKEFISAREQESNLSRIGTLNHIASRSPAQKALLDTAHTEDLRHWRVKMRRLFGRQLIRQHLQPHLKGASEHRLTLIAKKLMASGTYRVSHAIVNADIYLHWRAVRNAAVPRDLLPDLDHMVNASRCDVYATAEAKQGAYASSVLGRTSLAIYDKQNTLVDWLISLAKRGEIPTPLRQAK
jgi:hypothetical protein